MSEKTKFLKNLKNLHLLCLLHCRGHEMKVPSLFHSQRPKINAIRDISNKLLISLFSMKKNRIFKVILATFGGQNVNRKVFRLGDRVRRSIFKEIVWFNFLKRQLVPFSMVFCLGQGKFFDYGKHWKCICMS